jgi:hypothetical protein
MAVKYTLQDLTKFTQIGIFGLKIDHLATLHGSTTPTSFFGLFSTDPLVLPPILVKCKAV